METLTTDMTQCARPHGNDVHLMRGEYEFTVSGCSYDIRITTRKRIKKQIVDNNYIRISVYYPLCEAVVRLLPGIKYHQNPNFESI